jgi:hypothetical protein
MSGNKSELHKEQKWTSKNKIICGTNLKKYEEQIKKQNSIHLGTKWTSHWKKWTSKNKIICGTNFLKQTEQISLKKET